MRRRSSKMKTEDSTKKMLILQEECAMMNRQEYIESLRRLNPVIYLNGRRVESVVDDPMLKPHVNSAAMTYEMAFDPEFEDLMTTTSPDGEEDQPLHLHPPERG